MHIPLMEIAGAHVSPMDWTVGVVYVLRDFAQREIKHKVIFAMTIGCALSYVFAAVDIAMASLASFAVAEVIDWAIYTFTRKPLSQRILWSALISTPIDSLVFLYLMNQLNWAGIIILSLAKMSGVILIWTRWRFTNPDPCNYSI